MAMAMSAQQKAQQALQQNQAVRQLLLATAPRQRKNIGSFIAAALGTTTRVKLFNVGFITALQIAVTCPVTIGVAIAVPSIRAPYNLISSINLTDYDGTNRVSWSGYQLFVINCIRMRIPYGYNNQGPVFDANGSTVKSGIITNPSTPTAVGNGTISFLLDIPIAYDPESDLRGMIMGQTAIGEMYLAITWATLLYQNTNQDAVYAGAPTTTVVLNGVTGPTATVWQEYLMPQYIQGFLPVPAIDMQTVYELAGNLRSSDNLIVNAQKLITYPNVRSVIGGYFMYSDGGTYLANDISSFQLIANGNNILRDDSLLSQQIRQRNYLEGDLAPGIYWFLHRAKPIESALFGNVQAALTPTAVGAASFVEIGFESFFTKGSALPGISQA